MSSGARKQIKQPLAMRNAVQVLTNNAFYVGLTKAFFSSRAAPEHSFTVSADRLLLARVKSEQLKASLKAQEAVLPGGFGQAVQFGEVVIGSPVELAFRAQFECDLAERIFDLRQRDLSLMSYVYEEAKLGNDTEETFRIPAVRAAVALVDADQLPNVPAHLLLGLRIYDRQHPRQGVGNPRQYVSRLVDAYARDLLGGDWFPQSDEDSVASVADNNPVLFESELLVASDINAALQTLKHVALEAFYLSSDGVDRAMGLDEGLSV